MRNFLSSITTENITKTIDNGPSRDGGFTVRLDHVSYIPSNYKNKLIIDDISFEIPTGQFVSIVGSNAAGKSSIMKAICGELLPIEGTIYIGPHIIDKPVNQIVDGVGIIHQFENADLLDHLTVIQNIVIRQMLGNGHNDKIIAITKKRLRKIRYKMAMMNKLKLPDIGMNVGFLAGGEKQMLNIAIAIHFEHELNPCGLLLLDEHTSRLSPKNAEMVMEFTINEVNKNNITTIMVTHSYKDAIEYSDRILVVKHGKLLSDLNISETPISIESLANLIELESD